MNQETQQTGKDVLPKGHVVAGRYEIVEKLGSGGMGSVYRAEDLLLDRETVAMKVLHTKYLDDTDLLQRFLREVQLMRRVKHRNVVQTYDVGAEENLYFFTMEYVEGRSLEQVVRKENIPRKNIANLVIQICEGLEAIHQSGILHRDLKPGNVILLEDGTVRITDFGVARPEVSNLTAHNEILGSVCYIAPEIWLAQKPTISIDLYSLGIVLYEVSTGDVPFDGGSPAELMRLHLDRSPVPPKVRNPSTPSWLNRLILDLLAKSPKERPADARAVIDYVKLRASKRSTKRMEAAKNSPSPGSDDFIEELEKETQNITSSTNRPSVLSKESSAGITKSSLRPMPEAPPSSSAHRKIIKHGTSSRPRENALSLFFGYLGRLSALLVALLLTTTLLRLLFQAILPELSIPTVDTPMTELPVFHIKTRELIAFGLPWSVLFLVLTTLPLLLIYSVSSSQRTIARSFLSLFLFLTLSGLILLVIQLLPVLGQGTVSPLSLLSAARAAAEQLLGLSLLAPFTISFQEAIAGDGLLLKSVREIPIGTNFIVLSLSVVYVILITHSIGQALSTITETRGLLHLLVGLILLVFLLVEGYILPTHATSPVHGDLFFTSSSLSPRTLWIGVSHWLCLYLITICAAVWLRRQAGQKHVEKDG